MNILEAGMGIIPCYEPSLFPEHCIVRADRNDTIVYPHVDSCLAVTVFQGYGEKFWAIGGHCPMFDDAPQLSATGTLVRFCNRMCDSQNIRSSTIEKIIFVGGNKRKRLTEVEHYSISQALDVFGLSKQRNAANWALVNVRNCANGVDVFVDLPKQRLSIQKFQKDPSLEAFKPPPLRPQPFYSEAVHKIVGKIVEPKDSFF
jgi:hypothetical protein